MDFDAGQWFVDHGIPILLTIILAYAIYRFSKGFIKPAVRGYVQAKGRGRRTKSWIDKRAETLSSILTLSVGVIAAVVALIMILSEIGVDIGPLLAGAGVAGIAIGFGAQSLIKDFVSGLFIIMEDQYNKGDVIKVAGVCGSVIEINLRRTVLRDLDGIVHSIPNGEITVASNYTRDFARINFDIPVAYGENLDNAIKVINHICDGLSSDKHFGGLIKTPPKVLRVNNLGDSGIDIKILGEVEAGSQWEVTGELRKRLKDAFDKEGIEIPWPHVKVYYGEENAKAK